MESNDNFNAKKTFGLAVLMKLAKKNIDGISVETIGDRFVSNVSLNEIKEVVAHVIDTHKIRLKV